MRVFEYSQNLEDRECVSHLETENLHESQIDLLQATEFDLLPVDFSELIHYPLERVSPEPFESKNLMQLVEIMYASPLTCLYTLLIGNGEINADLIAQFINNEIGFRNKTVEELVYFSGTVINNLMKRRNIVTETHKKTITSKGRSKNSAFFSLRSDKEICYRAALIAGNMRTIDKDYSDFFFDKASGINTEILYLQYRLALLEYLRFYPDENIMTVKARMDTKFKISDRAFETTIKSLLEKDYIRYVGNLITIPDEILVKDMEGSLFTREQSLVKDVFEAIKIELEKKQLPMIGDSKNIKARTHTKLVPISYKEMQDIAFKSIKSQTPSEEDPILHVKSRKACEYLRNNGYLRVYDEKDNKNDELGGWSSVSSITGTYGRRVFLSTKGDNFFNKMRGLFQNPYALLTDKGLNGFAQLESFQTVASPEMDKDKSCKRRFNEMPNNYKKIVNGLIKHIFVTPNEPQTQSLTLMKEEVTEIIR